MYINSTYNTYSQNFTSSGRDVCNSLGELIHRNDTSLFRSDLGNWDHLIDYIGEKFKNAPKANLYSLSCSAGDEVYSLAMKLLAKYGEKGAEKYFPILASDYDAKIISMAQKGYLPMFEGDDKLINEHTHGKFNKYFEIVKTVPDFIKNMDLDYDFIAKVKPELRNKVSFKVADATEECKSVNPNNSIVMARNFWPYLKDETTRIQMSNNLYKRLDKNSAVIIGSFDDTPGTYASKNLYDAGFRCNLNNCCIYEKNAIPITEMYYC